MAIHITQLNSDTFNPLTFGSKMSLEIRGLDHDGREHFVNQMADHNHQVLVGREKLVLEATYRELGNIIPSISRENGPLAEAMRTYWSGNRVSFDAGDRSFDITDQPLIHAIINLSPESFYDGQDHNVDEVLATMQGMYDRGIRFFDIGGKSTNPKAKNVDFEEEWSRIQPYLGPIYKRFSDVVLSVDSNNPQTIDKALKNGVQVINSIDGFETPAMLDLVDKYQAAVITTYNNRDKPTSNVADQTLAYLTDQVSQLTGRGLEKENIILDPGVGFTSNRPGITPEQKAHQDVEKMQSIAALSALKMPVMVGVSNKSFMGTLFDLDLDDRLVASLLVEYHLITTGGRIVRVHNIPETELLLQIFDTLSI